jgi:hypothetical protein
MLEHQFHGVTVELIVLDDSGVFLSHVYFAHSGQDLRSGTTEEFVDFEASAVTTDDGEVRGSID